MSNLIPVGAHVYIEPIYDVKSTGGIDLGVQERFAVSGWIYSVGAGCTEALRSGDFVCLEEHGFRESDLLQDTFFITLEDGEGSHIVRADMDVEPVIREQWHKYQRTKEDVEVATYDIARDKEPVRFLTSDIRDIQIGSYTETGYTISYRHHFLLDRLVSGLDRDLMLVPEREILFTIAAEDLEDV